MVVISELLKEKKRQEYVLKQKAKLANYQSKVKSEAEKIQVGDMMSCEREGRGGGREGPIVSCRYHM